MILPVVLCILDGWGVSPNTVGNAITQSHTPCFSGLWNDFPHTLLRASGADVGLPAHQTGNSEAGHLNIGAGRIVEQDAVYISRQITEGTFFTNPKLFSAVQHVKKHHSTLHLMGLLSNGQSGHMIPEHLFALLEFCSKHQVSDVVLHLFTDGRDSPPRSAMQYVDDLEEAMHRWNVGRIGTLMGRHYAMDRAKIWERTLKAYNALTAGSNIVVQSAKDAIKRSYGLDVSDEYLEPTTIISNGHEDSLIHDHDAVIFFNLRSDRARQITKAFVQSDFEDRHRIRERRQHVLSDVFFVAMTDFGPDLPSILTAFPSHDVKNSLPQVWSHLRQLYVAESEKYAHITYFFNGGYQDAVGNEDRKMIPSLPVISFVQSPEMSAREICDTAVDAITSDRYDIVGMNFANADMVAHTGDIRATIQAVEFLDTQIQRLVDIVRESRGILVLVGDHGNAEVMVNPMTGEINTHHDASLVPLILVGESVQHIRLAENGVLGNVAPTLLSAMGCAVPNEMTCPSLILPT
ncbi:MAG: 2,3-bisphosphoglycerate-independent phosphoglycerate mutase [Candidatus Kerfeldbacteria bacterium]|nr:2,3-bisphosphoglycerate-independent phosphoglycerate mutase [Candidatus Kerfeldbacteria bacterium]